MATQFTHPGVYIQEFAPPAPIQAAGTSTAAFIGPATLAPPNTPIKVTSMNEFVAAFGAEPLDGFYLWYAVQGFFNNNGQVCYGVRASNGTYGSITLNDSSPGANPLLTVQATQLGIPSPAINVQVTPASVFNATVFQPTPDTYTVTGVSEITLASPNLAAQFRPGDSLNLGLVGNHVIVRYLPPGGGLGPRFRFNENLNSPIGTTGSVTLSDYATGAQTFRLEWPAPPGPPTPGSIVPTGLLVPGTMLTFTQGGADTQMVDSVTPEYLGTTPAITTYRVTLRRGLAIGISISAAATAQSREFNLVVSQGPGSTTFANLSIDPEHPRYYQTIVNSAPNPLVTVQPIAPPPSSAPPDNLPAGVGPVAIPAGTPETLSTIGPAEYLNALASLEPVIDVNQIACPDAAAMTNPVDVQAVQQAMITHCEQMGNRFAVLDSQPGLPLFGATSIETQRATLDSARGYAALYYPWVSILGVRPGPPILVPPSGHICGIMARVDATRGVFKAPANEPVSGALGLERTMSDADQGQLNLMGINVIRVFPGSSVPIVWGARTTSPDTNWQYVNVRRLFLFLEASIQQGIQWAVFEPNTTGLWAKLSRTLTDFLTRVWRDGALFGTTAAQAFYVRIDDTINPASTRALGQLYIQIGVAPSYPAEFVIVRIGIWQGGSDVAEG